jgi:LysM domain
MATRSAAEARLDAAIRPEITMLRSRTSYPARYRPARAADGAAAGRSLRIVREHTEQAQPARVPDAGRRWDVAGGSGADAVIRQAPVGGRIYRPGQRAPFPGDPERSESARPPRGEGARATATASRVAADGCQPSVRPAGRRSADARVPAVAQPVAARPRAIRLSREGGAVTASARPAGLRLTRRGRIVVAAIGLVAALAISALAWLAVAGQAQASSHARPGVPPASGLVRVIVRPGQTLWSIAVHAEPSADPRAVIQEITDLNSLGSPAIHAGQVLWVPRG